MKAARLLTRSGVCILDQGLNHFLLPFKLRLLGADEDSHDALAGRLEDADPGVAAHRGPGAPGVDRGVAFGFGAGHGNLGSTRRRNTAHAKMTLPKLCV